MNYQYILGYTYKLIQSQCFSKQGHSCPFTCKLARIGRTITGLEAILEPRKSLQLGLTSTPLREAVMAEDMLTEEAGSHCRVREVAGKRQRNYARSDV
jgi:hypothetical protein